MRKNLIGIIYNVTTDSLFTNNIVAALNEISKLLNKRYPQLFISNLINNTKIVRIYLSVCVTFGTDPHMEF